MATGGVLWVSVRPSLDGFGADLRRQIEESVPPEIRVRIRPDGDPAQDGARMAGEFAASFRARLAASLRSLPDIEITADSSPAEREIAELRARMTALRDLRIGVDIDAATAQARLSELETELNRLARQSPDIQVRVDAAAAAAELEAFRAEVERLDGQHADIKIDTAAARGSMSALLTVGLSLAPALIPVGAAIAAGLASIGPAALAGVGAIGALGLAFSGVGAAIGLADKAQTQAGSNAGKVAGQQATAAASIVSAQDGVTASERALAMARAQAADGAISASEKVRSAVQSEAAARVNATAAIRSALQTQASAEQTLVDAQRAGQRAQENLTQARKSAAAALLSLTFQTEDNALAQRSAAIQLAQAKETAAAFERTGGSSLQRDQVTLGVDEAQQRARELRSQGADLATQKADATKKGIEGSTQVTAAQDAVTAAVRRTQDAERALQNSSLAVTKAQVDGRVSIEKAEQSLADARRAQAMQQLSSENSIESAVQGVASAQRSLESAQRATAQSTASASKATDAYATAMAKLSPAAREFVEFYTSTMKPRLEELKATAGAGLFPGLQAGLTSASPVFGQLKTFISNISTAMGDLARDAGKALTQPFWHDFFDFMNRTAGPTIRDLGTIFGNWSQGLAGIFQALYQPIFVPIMQWFKDLSARVRDFGTSAAAGTNGSFNSFIDYVKENGPKVRDLIKAVFDIVKKLVEGLAGQGGGTLSVLVSVLQWFAQQDPAVLAALYNLFVAFKLAQLGAGLLSGLATVIANLGVIRSVIAGISLSGGLIGALGIVALVAGLQLVSTELDKMNAKWQQGPDGKPTTQAQKTLGQSAVNDGVGALHKTVNSDDGGQLKQAYHTLTTGESTFGPTKEQFKNSTAGKALDGVKGMVGDINKWLEDNISKPMAKFFGGLPKAIDKWWNDSVWTPTKTFFEKLPGVISKWWIDNVESPTKGWFTALGGNVKRWWNDYVWTPTKTFFSSLPSTISKWWTDNVETPTRTWFAAQSANIQRWWNDHVWAPTRAFFEGLPGNVKRWWNDNVSAPTGEFFADLGRNVSRWWEDHVSNPLKTVAARMWDGLKGIFKDGTNGLIGAINSMTGGINVVLRVVHVAEIPPIPKLEAGGILGPQMLAAGGTVGAGFVTNGPRAIVGEGNPSHPEFVIPTDPQHRIRAMKLYESLGGKLMADGGILGGIGDWLGNAASTVWGGIKSTAASVAGAVGSATSWIGAGVAGLISQIKASVAAMLPKNMFGDVGVGAASNILGGVQKVIESAYQAMQAAASSYAPGGGAAPPGQISAWIAEALKILGYPQDYSAGIYQQIMTESGGNPGVTQHGYTDVNTLSGNLAQGLMQVIPPTFRAHMLPGHGNPFNPVDNIIAGSRYAMGRYGPGWFAPGPQHSHGYDSGGMLMPGVTAAFNGSGKPERVLTATQNIGFEHLVGLAKDQKFMRSLSAWTVDGPQVARVAAGVGRDRASALAPAGDTFHITARDDHSEVRIASEIQRKRDFARRTR